MDECERAGMIAISCDCPCHTDPNVKHIAPCCYPETVNERRDMPNKRHDENARAFDLRDELAEAIRVQANQDARISVEREDHPQVWYDLAEWMVREGWVTLRPGEE